jgi:putative tryptophan/tyrosine transport system substrate-binding protein
VRIGFLSLFGNAHSSVLNAFRQGLRELGYVEGQGMIIEDRWAQENPHRLADFAAELVRLKVDVIVAARTLAIRAAKTATTALPIVMVAAGDPVGTGLITSLAHPGGNITGLATLTTELSGKRLELLKEGLTYPLLSDTRREMAKAYDVLFDDPNWSRTLRRYGGIYMRSVLGL